MKIHNDVTVPGDMAITEALQYTVSEKPDEVAGKMSRNEGTASKMEPNSSSARSITAPIQFFLSCCS